MKIILSIIIALIISSAVLLYYKQPPPVNTFEEFMFLYKYSYKAGAVNVLTNGKYDEDKWKTDSLELVNYLVK